MDIIKFFWFLAWGVGLVSGALCGVGVVGLFLTDETSNALYSILFWGFVWLVCGAFIFSVDK